MTTTRDKTTQTVFLFAEAHSDPVIREWLNNNYSKLELEAFAHEFKNGLSIGEIIELYQKEVIPMNNRAQWSNPENNKLHLLEDWGKKSLLQQLIIYSISKNSFSEPQRKALNKFTSLDINNFNYGDYKKQLLTFIKKTRIQKEISKFIDTADKITANNLLTQIKDEEPSLRSKRLLLTLLKNLQEASSLKNYSIDLPAFVDALEQSKAIDRSDIVFRFASEREAFFAENILEILSQTTGNLAFLCGFAHAIPVSKILLKAGVKVCICYNANPQHDILAKETISAKKPLVIIKKLYPTLASEIPLTPNLTIEEFNQLAKPSTPKLGTLFAADQVQPESSGKAEVNVEDTPRQKK